MDFTRRTNQNRPSSRLAIPLRRERFPLIDLEALDDETDLAAKRAAAGGSGLQPGVPAAVVPGQAGTALNLGTAYGESLLRDPAPDRSETPAAPAESAVAATHPEPQPAITRRLPRALPARARAGKAKA